MKNICDFEYDTKLSTLKDEGVSNADIARRLGVTKDAVRQMILAKRDIYLIEIDGRLHYRDLGAWKHEPDKGINRLTGKRARPVKLLKKGKAA